ncbi:MAG: helix-turn-helix domain-containing protein [Pseudomonadales bacterium]|jgi:AraC-like DNA-binding protein|nr:helix-turn-helix domain-containing protein [Pseudomonadales bacterium]MCP5320440.1 helix-turn-helix domain-containing protein [Pseudomonadales bacterium]MCP5336802.1 helix-turn-helix domain-containing protein [Pseudomonadales bacterium]
MIENNSLQESVRDAHITVGTEMRGRPIQRFSCRDLRLANLELFEITIDPIVIHRRVEDISEDRTDDYLLATQLQGTVLIKQGNIEFTQCPGSLVMMSAGEPYSIIHTQQSHRLILHFPAALFRERVLGHMKSREYRPRLMPPGGLVTVVCAMLRSAALDAGEFKLPEQYALAENLLELTAAMLRSETDVEYERKHSRQSALFRRILEFMEANFMDAEMSPEKIAKANGISMRYLHSLFFQAGISVSKWLWERRLRAARDDLLDPQLRHMRVSEIAFGRGFNDPAHFSRSFRKRFAVSPLKLRQDAEVRRAAEE